jgi:hypothetical protein
MGIVLSGNALDRRDAGTIDLPHLNGRGCLPIVAENQFGGQLFL